MPGDGPGGPSPPGRWRWVRNLAFSVPLIATLAVVLLLAGSVTVMRMVGDGREGGGGAVPLDRTDFDVDLDFDPEAGPTGAAARELQRRGRIGDDDSLTPTRERRLGSRLLTRASQEHNGIPVFAAEVVVTTDGERIVKIHGHPAPDIELDTTTPANDYPATVALAEGLLSLTIAPEDDGMLVIIPVDDGYRLAWLGVCVIDEEQEQVALDAETGEVLHRVPILQETAHLPGTGNDAGDHS